MPNSKGNRKEERSLWWAPAVSIQNITKFLNREESYRYIPVPGDVDFCNHIEGKKDECRNHNEPWRHRDKKEEIHAPPAGVNYSVSGYRECYHQRELKETKQPRKINWNGYL